MKKGLLVMALVFGAAVAAEQRAAAEGGFKICFGVSCNKWNGCGGGCPCFPCADPALFGLPGGCGYGYDGYAPYGGYLPYGGYGPYAGYAPYGYAPAAAPAPAAPTAYPPQGVNPYGYQPAGSYAPFGGSYPTSAYWYGY